MNNAIAVTMDDPADIGLEIIIKSLSETGLAGAPVVVVDCMRTLRRVMAMSITPQAELRVIQKMRDAHFAPDVINVMDEPLVNPDALAPGMVRVATGGLAYRCIKRATALALSGEMKAVAAALLNKEALYLGGHNYPGHMELLAHLADSREYAMVLCTDKLKVIHISTHILLRKFLDTLNNERVRTVIRVANHFLKRVDIECPRIAMAGVNPHAGEHGLFGTEKIRVITPTVEAMQAKDISATSPCPPDAVFIQYHEGLSDMVVATYRDQRHIPLKLLGFYDGVNITAGLPFIRTSADHDTALDIAWIERTRSESMAVSIQLVMQASRE